MIARLRLLVFVLRHGYTPDTATIERLWGMLCEAWDEQLRPTRPALTPEMKLRIWREVQPYLEDHTP